MRKMNKTRAVEKQEFKKMHKHLHAQAHKMMELLYLFVYISSGY